MKKYIVILCVIFLSMPVRAEEPSVSAKSAVVLEYATGKIVYAKNENEKLPMASTTKIMTALIALERGNLSDIVTIGPKASGVEGSSMYLKTGEQLTLEELLYGLMLSSGNDAAVAIAEHIAGSEEAFAKMMTERAVELGCTNTAFQNANGLPDDAHYTTAFELARITGKALENAKFREIAASKSARVGMRQLTNHNKLLSMYEGAIGVKTGFTKASGRTLVSAAVRDGVELIAVTLSAPDDWDDHMKMLDYGFANMERRHLATGNAIAGTVVVEDGIKAEAQVCFAGDFALSVRKQEKTEILYILPPSIAAPVQKGEEIGKAEFLLEGIKMGEVGLVIGETVDAVAIPSLFDYMHTIFIKWAKLFLILAEI